MFGQESCLENQKHLMLPVNLRFVAKSEIELRIRKVSGITLEATSIEILNEQLLFQNSFFVIFNLDIHTVLHGE